MSMPGRMMGLDIGEARIGVALSDPMGIIASPHGVIAGQDAGQALAEIRSLAEAQGVTAIVAGVPLNQHGQPGPQAEKVLAFVERLREAVDVPVDTIDERFTSAQAERTMASAGKKKKGNKGLVDQLAAQQILETWMAKRKREGGYR